VVLSASTLNILSQASLSARVAQSTTSLTRATMLSHAATASWAEASAGCITVARATSIATVPSHARITSSSFVGTPTVPRDRRYISKGKGV
jgi:hypothetical protein